MQTATNKLEISWANTSWILDSRRVLIHPNLRILVLSDIHIGYYSSLRSEGSYLPTYDSLELQKTIDSLLTDYNGYHWIIAGDIKHNLGTYLSVEELSELQSILSSITSSCNLTLIIGNHDTGLHEILQDLNINCSVVSTFIIENIVITHNQEFTVESSDKKFIIGHFHPIISTEFLKGIYVPIFVVGDDFIILPAFNTVAGGFNIKNFSFHGKDKKKCTIYGIGKKIYDLGPLENHVN